VARERILVVDDEAAIRGVIVPALVAEGFEVDEADDGESALALFRRRPHDLVVLDLRMPGIDGLDVLRELRRTSNVYVIVVTARTEEADRVVGLELGADDYVSKPFSPRELVARVRAGLRRLRDTDPHEADAAMRFDALTVDVARHEVLVDGTAVALTGLEFEILAALASAPGRVFTRRQLIERIWGWDFYGDERLVDVHVRGLRKALGDPADSPRFVGTVRGVGYKCIAVAP
jgi:DNA-binding response OmpR family regulator